MTFDYQTISTLAGAVAFGWGACRFFIAKVPSTRTLAYKALISAFEAVAKADAVTPAQAAAAAAAQAHEDALRQAVQDIAAKLVAAKL